MKRVALKTRTLAAGTLVAGAAVVGLAVPSRSNAQEAGNEGKSERCAVRVSIGLLGTAPAGAVLSGDPQAQVDAIVRSPEFAERFARYVNANFNQDPGATSAEDASYHLAKYVLTSGKKWQDLFVGGYDVAQANANAAATVTESAAGLGYFRSRAWMTRYAGNELAGMRISAAYRIMNNVVGLKLLATTNAPGADVTATGRAAPACRSCHFDSWSALDSASEVLGTVVRNGQNVTFQPYTGAPKPLFGGAAMVQDDKGFVEALVASENFTYQACSLAFQYLHGRRENVCESQVFDKCVDAFKASGMIQSGLAAIAKDPTFCQ